MHLIGLVKANQWGPRKVMMLILFILMITVGACAFTQTPMQLLILRIFQGVVGGYVPIGLAIIVLITPENKVPGQWAYTKRLWLWASSLDRSWVALWPTS